MAANKSADSSHRKIAGQDRASAYSAAAVSGVTWPRLIRSHLCAPAFSTAVALVATVAIVGCGVGLWSEGPLPTALVLQQERGGTLIEDWPAAARRPSLYPVVQGVAAGFHDDTMIRGLTQPTALRFLPGGALLVAEQRGIVKIYPAADRDEPQTLIDIRTEVFGWSQLGLLGLAVDPDYPVQPYVYVAYTLDAPLGGTPPTYGSVNGDGETCPNNEIPTCLVSARVSRFRITDGRAGPEEILVQDWCESSHTHTIGTIAFGRDGALFAGAGDGAQGDSLDYGNVSSPPNACGDPPVPAGSIMDASTAEGGQLRAQDLQTRADPVGLDGTIIRVDRATGAPLADNPLAGDADVNAARIVAYGMRNPFRFTLRPGTDELWIADVGWNKYEEINRLIDPLSAPPANLGWPCYEGPRPEPKHAANGAICKSLYANEPSGLLFPAVTLARGKSAGNSCDSPGAALSAVAFYDGSAFPAAYSGALFFADYVRACMWVMTAGADGVPDPYTVRDFRVGVRPVDMTVGADGALYYVDLETSSIRRISAE